MRLAVIVSDSVGRAFRNGVVGIAIGAAGLPALLDLRGRPDLEGRPLEVTQVGLADQIASAARAPDGRGRRGPARGPGARLFPDGPALPASALIRAREADLFR